MSDTDTGSGAAPRRGSWVRLGSGLLALGLLTWGSVQAGAWGPGSDGGQSVASTAADTEAAGGGEQPVLVEEARLACAGVSGSPGASAAALAPPELFAEQPTGQRSATLSPVAGSAGSDVLELRADQEVAETPPAEDATSLLTATGPGAPGLVGGHLSVGTGSGSRGAALVGCAAAAAEHWLLGGDAAAGRTEQVVLTNPGTDPVRVDLEVHGAEGPVEATGASGLVVPAGGRLVRPLDALAPGTAAPAVHVAAEGGPVTAHLVDTSREGTTDLGVDVTGPSAEAARDLVIPPLPDAGADGTETVLRLLAPEADAVVELGALTEDGAATPGTSAVRVAAGTTTDVPLDGLPEGAVGLRVRSDHPVTASLQVRLAPSGDEPVDQEVAEQETTDGEAATATAAPDGATATGSPQDQEQPLVRPAGELAWVPAAGPATQPVGIGLPDRAAVPGAETSLSVAVLDATVVEVLLRAADGSTRVETLELGNDSTALLPLAPDVRGVWVRPAEEGGTGVVAAAVHLTGSDDLGPYRAAAVLAAVPWSREVTGVSRVVP